MDGSGFFLLSAAEQIEKFEEWVEVPVSNFTWKFDISNVTSLNGQENI